MHSCHSQFRILAERNFPENFACVETDGIQGSPRRKNSGIAVGVEKTIIAGEMIFHRGRRRSRAGEFLILVVGKQIRDGLGLFLR